MRKLRGLLALFTVVFALTMGTAGCVDPTAPNWHGLLGSGDWEEDD